MCPFFGANGSTLPGTSHAQPTSPGEVARHRAAEDACMWSTSHARRMLRSNPLSRAAGK